VIERDDGYLFVIVDNNLRCGTFPSEAAARRFIETFLDAPMAGVIRLDGRR